MRNAVMQVFLLLGALVAYHLLVVRPTSRLAPVFVQTTPAPTGGSVSTNEDLSDGIPFDPNATKVTVWRAFSRP